MAHLMLVPVPCTVTEAAMARLRAQVAWEWLADPSPAEQVEIPYMPGKRLVYALDGDTYTLVRSYEGAPGMKHLSVAQMRALMRAFTATRGV